MPLLPLAAPEVKRLAGEVDAVAADGTFSGHACVFGAEDLAHDVVERGAFLASLARRGAAGVKMLWHHDPAEPIGRWLEVREDARGLFVRGRLLDGLARGREAATLMRAGVLDGLSIGFRAVRGARDRKSGIRRLTEIDLWEISLVTFPMQPEARIAAVETAGADPRARAHLLATIRRATALIRTTR
ncbi:HK97 family phage prohead protease [Siculibacillus lacustris]|uniref:HK97 family phage prohead protease n=1 Tax=Siculibacillus lacustris TaxID=1549641 RepID=A0A4Q9VYB2_9HYPH|nr:HK97 family phage prohead protease [Siculibacillus lacustris]TBW40992.1 HK97 family phage prohead protease [Siculibacillus lacustris]